MDGHIRGEAEAVRECPLDAEPTIDHEIVAKLRTARKPAEYGVLGARRDDAVFEIDAVQYWGNAMLGVSLAGGCYGLAFLVVGAIMGVVFVTILCTAFVVPFALAVRTITGRWVQPLAAPAFGGLVGLVATAPVLSALAEGPAFGLWTFLLGPMATTLLGQAGGYLATRQFAYVMALGARNRRRERWHFTIRTLLIATAWAAVIATGLRILGLATPAHGIAIALWLIWQAGLLWFWAWRIRRTLDSRRRIPTLIVDRRRPIRIDQRPPAGALHVKRTIEPDEATFEICADGST